MEKILIVFMLILSGCGMSETLSRGCGGDMDMFCDMLFGSDPDKTQEMEDRLDRIEDQVQEHYQVIDSLTVEISDLERNLNNNSNDLSNVTNEISVLEDYMHSEFERLTTLVTEMETTSTIDPCGAHSGYDEVLLRLSNGSLVAYFKENGHYEFLSVLTPGMYRTTDRQRCLFEVKNDGSVVW